MIINIEPDQEVKRKMNICEFHKKNPGVSFAGCTCTGIYLSSKKREEIIDRHKKGASK